MFLRCLKPSGKHKSFRFQKRTGTAWVTVKTDEIAAFNALFRSGTLSDADAEKRSATILAGLYAERDKEKPILVLSSGNQKILQNFLVKAYPDAKKRRMGKRSLQTEGYYLKQALAVIGEAPIEAESVVLQKLVDDKLEPTPKKHKRVTTSINRLRKSLGLGLLHHLPPQPKDEIAHILEAEVSDLIIKLDEPYATLVGVAFYTGLRKGEIFGLQADDLKGDVIFVRRQIILDGTTTLPKHRKTRRAFVISGGETFLKKWMQLKKNVRRDLRISDETQRLAGIRFHDLRHSYAVHLITKGASIDWVAQSLGNSRETCERHYASHILADDSITLMRKLGL